MDATPILPGTILGEGRPAMLLGLWGADGTTATAPDSSVLQRELEALNVSATPVSLGDAKSVTMLIRPRSPITVGTLLLLVSSMGGVGRVIDASSLPAAAFDIQKNAYDFGLAGAGSISSIYDGMAKLATPSGWAERNWWLVVLVAVLATAGVMYWRLK